MTVTIIIGFPVIIFKRGKQLLQRKWLKFELQLIEWHRLLLQLVYLISLFRFLDVVSGNYHRDTLFSRDLLQMNPETVQRNFIYIIAFCVVYMKELRRWRCTCLSLKTGSKPTVGSSRINNSGLWSRDTPKDTLLCWPPLMCFRRRFLGGSWSKSFSDM